MILAEPDEIIPKEKLSVYQDILDAKLMQANPSYGEMRRSGVLGHLELLPLQQQTYQLYRDLLVMKGRSANQIKPVRVIDTPMKEKFFFGLRERYDR